MASGLDIIKNTLGLHDEGGNKLSGMSNKYTLFNETQNKIITESNDVTYRVEVYEKLLKSFVGKYYNKTPKNVTGTSKKKINKTRTGDDETLDFIIQYITLYFETYKSITLDVDTYNVENDLEVLEKLKKMKMNSSTRIYEIIHRLSDVDAEKKIRSKTSEVFSIVEKLVASYIKFKKDNHKNIAQTIVEETKNVAKNAWKKKGKIVNGVLVAGAGFAMTEAGSFLGHLFKHEKIGSIARVPGEAFLARAAVKAENFRDKQKRLKESLEKLDRDSKKSRVYKEIKSKFGGGGSYKALRSSTVMVGDNPGGQESISIGNQAFKTKGPSLLRIKAGQSIQANPLSGMGKTRVNPQDFDALGGGTEEPITATTNTDRITDALDKNTEVLELIYKEQHNKFREDKKLGRRKTLGEHIGGFIDSPDKKGYIKNIISKSSTGNKSIGEHVGGFLDSKNKKGYLKNIIKDKTFSNMLGEAGIAGGVGETGGLAGAASTGVGETGGLAGAASTAMKAEKATSLLAEMAELAGAGAVLPTLATGAAITAGVGALGYGGYKMATGHNAGAVPASMASSMGGSYTPSYSASPEQLANAIKKTESGGNYGVKGASGEHGAYQYMPGTWNKYSSEYAKGTGMTGKVEMTPANQDAVTQFKIKQWKAQGLSDQDIAAKWNAGEGVKNWQNKIGVNSKGVSYNTPAYVNKVMSNVQGVSPTANNPVPVTPKKLAEKQLEVVKAQSDLHTKAKADEQAKKDALAKASSKTSVNVADNNSNVDRETSSKGTTVLSSGDSSLLTTFNAQWGRS